MKKRTFIALLLCAALLLPVFGCAAPIQSATPAPSNSPAQGTVSATPGAKPVVMQKLSAAPLLAPDYDQQQSVANVGAFGFALANKLYKPGENMVVSPYSVWLTLAALANATDQSALPQLLKALGVDMRADELNKAVSRQLYELTGNEGKGQNSYNPLAIANAVFVDQDEKLNTAFAQKFLDYYRGAAMNVNFQDPSAVDAINAWAKEQTKGLIPEIVQEIPKQTVAALANAVYFSDRWVWEFNEKDTQKLVFHSAKGDTDAMFMLHDGTGIPYYEDAGMQAVDLSFKSGGGMTILLPKDKDAGKLLGSLSGERFSEILANAGHATGKLLLPRFKMDSAYTLNDALKAMGVPLFDANDPKLTALVQSTPAYIAAALHKAVIEVDEKGTTAAAVTVEMMAGSAMPLPTAPFSMTCDHPFVFVLHRYAGGAEQVLFAGVVNTL